MITYQVTTYYYGLDEDGTYCEMIDDVLTCESIEELTRLLTKLASKNYLFRVESYEDGENSEDTLNEDFAHVFDADEDDIDF